MIAQDLGDQVGQVEQEVDGDVAEHEAVHDGEAIRQDLREGSQVHLEASTRTRK